MTFFIKFFEGARGVLSFTTSKIFNMISSAVQRTVDEIIAREKRAIRLVLMMRTLRILTSLRIIVRMAETLPFCNNVVIFFQRKINRIVENFRSKYGKLYHNYWGPGRYVRENGKLKSKPVPAEFRPTGLRRNWLGHSWNVEGLIYESVSSMYHPLHLNYSAAFAGKY
jgi:hypothetical protein